MFKTIENIKVQGYKIEDDKLYFKIKILGPITEEQIQDAINKYAIDKFLKNKDLWETYKLNYCAEGELQLDDINIYKSCLEKISSNEFSWNYKAI